MIMIVKLLSIAAFVLSAPVPDDLSATLASLPITRVTQPYICPNSDPSKISEISLTPNPLIAGKSATIQFPVALKSKLEPGYVVSIGIDTEYLGFGVTFDACKLLATVDNQTDCTSLDVPTAPFSIDIPKYAPNITFALQIGLNDNNGTFIQCYKTNVTVLSTSKHHMSHWY
ncbi:hypothetical protein BC833DRAFT_563576 [Globomyces pollinis-pini]|nr:hypothetical protein BC833DRAFT_563576 [Globomyces pollinis-pini]